jgi:MoaA/NifB/PqqE/SkfB family radical SAM enzyme
MNASPRTVSFSKNAGNVFFHILTGCNLKCRHCYINKKQHGETLVSEQDMESWLALFAGRHPHSNVIFLGGEPTLHPGLPFAVKKAKRLGYTSVTVDTNGYLFHDFLDKVSPLDLDFLSFSLDGSTKATNDSIRGEGCYDTCTAGIRKAVEKGFSTSLIYTVSGMNFRELEKMPELLSGLGIKEFFIQVIGIRGKSAEKGGKGLQLTRRTWLDTVPAVAETVASMGIGVTYPKVFLEDGETFECAGNVADNSFIFPNGRVYRCPLCEDFPVHAFEIRDNVLTAMPRLNETDFFKLDIPEGCVMNKMIQPDNLSYDNSGRPEYRIACCLLKQRIDPL